MQFAYSLMHCLDSICTHHDFLSSFNPLIFSYKHEYLWCDWMGEEYFFILPRDVFHGFFLAMNLSIFFRVHMTHKIGSCLSRHNDFKIIRDNRCLSTLRSPALPKNIFIILKNVDNISTQKFPSIQLIPFIGILGKN